MLLHCSHSRLAITSKWIVIMSRFAKNTVISTLFMSIIYILLYNYVDQKLALYLSTHIDSKTVDLSTALSLIATPKLWTLIGLIGFAVFWVLYHQNRLFTLRKSILYISSSIILAQTIGTFIKYMLGRARPILFLQEHFYGFHPFTFDRFYHSTPSGHSLSIFAVACMTYLLFRRLGWLAFLVAIMVAVTRVILNEHFLSDVVLGAYLGGLSAVLAYSVLQQNIYHEDLYVAGSK